MIVTVLLSMTNYRMMWATIRIIMVVLLVLVVVIILLHEIRRPMVLLHLVVHGPEAKVHVRNIIRYLVRHNEWICNFIIICYYDF